MWIHLSDRYPRYTNATVLWANEHPDATDPIRDRHIISTAGPPLPGVRRRHGPLPAADCPFLCVMLPTTKRMLITARRSRVLARPSARACVHTCACASAQLTLHACVFVCAQVTRGLESTTFALLAGFTNFGGTLSGQIGLFLTQVTLIFIQCKLC